MRREWAGNSEMKMRDIEWKISVRPVGFSDAVEKMEQRVEAIQAGSASELIWLLEHPPLYTAGTSADSSELFNPQGFPVFQAGRGGRHTYHGPGQRVGYVLLDLNRRGQDVRRFVHELEGWLIGALAQLDVAAFRAPGRVGIWVTHQGREAKVGAIGVRIKRWVTLHGFSINIDPELSHFSGIVPCGIANFPVTSLDEMGVSNGQERFDLALRLGLDHFLSSLEGRT